jgi:ethanolamine ammonia-lyase small subunit/amino acid transporter
MSLPDDSSDSIAEDIRTLHRLGYAQELARRMGGFSNLAISLSIICILAGGITSFHLGYCSVGGAAIGIGWPLVCVFSLVVALTMGQVASAFPTAGGLYHWAAILGGRGWGWATAWFNLAGLVTVLAAINVGTFQFTARAFASHWAADPWIQMLAVIAITVSQAVVNHLGIRLTSRLTDFSGYWILFVAGLLTVALLAWAPTWEPARLIAVSNHSGLPEGAPIWPATTSLWTLFALGFLFPAYTITGFDASAHVAEETVNASRNVPRGIVRSVLVSGVAGWLMLVALLLAIPETDVAARQGDNIVLWIIDSVLPSPVGVLLCGGIAIAQYLCGLATVTSASRMAYAFARDGGLPASAWLRRVCPRYRTPDVAIWFVAIGAILFTLSTPVYSTITAVCTIFLYVSYVLPTGLGFLAHGRSWTQFGPWHLRVWFKPLAAISVLGCCGLIVIGMQPPNDKAVLVVGGGCVLLLVCWFSWARRSFPGPPHGLLSPQREHEIFAAEEAVHQPHVADDIVAHSDQPSCVAPTTEGVADGVSVGVSDGVSNGVSDLADSLRLRTPARILVGRAGPAYRTATQLELRRDHASAVDAVRAEMDLERDWGSAFLETWRLFAVSSCAASKDEYLRRPDLGRRLSESACESIAANCPAGSDLQIVLSDGLSATAIAAQAPALLPLLIAAAREEGWSVGRPFFVHRGRVGLLNEVGRILRPEVVVLLIGERPGMATAESLSAYMAFRPQPGDTDARRNLVSNIHRRGVSAEVAARRILSLARKMRAQQSSGVEVKED